MYQYLCIHLHDDCTVTVPSIISGNVLCPMYIYGRTICSPQYVALRLVHCNVLCPLYMSTYTAADPESGRDREGHASPGPGTTSARG